MIDVSELATLEYEALQAEKRDRMNARLQVWSLLIGLISAFGLASVQPGSTGYIVVLYPFLALCLVRYASHSESVLEQVKSYLLKDEQKSHYEGYEHFNTFNWRRKSGGHIKALRDAVALTQGAATLVVCTRLFSDFPSFSVLVIGALEMLIIGVTWISLSQKRGNR